MRGSDGIRAAEIRFNRKPTARLRQNVTQAPENAGMPFGCARAIRNFLRMPSAFAKAIRNFLRMPSALAKAIRKKLRMGWTRGIDQQKKDGAWGRILISFIHLGTVEGGGHVAARRSGSVLVSLLSDD